MASGTETERSGFEILLQNYIKILDDIIAKLNDFTITIAHHHRSCNIAKTCGTSVSSVGVAVVVGSVLCSPFTGGGTLAIGASGAIMSITGGLSNVITDYVDYKTSAMIMNDIQLILKSKEDFDKKLKWQLSNFGILIEKLIENGVDKDSAIAVAVTGIANGCIDLSKEPNMKLMNTLSTIIKLHHIESAALETLPIISKTMHISEKSFQFIYNFLGLTGHSAAAVFKTIGRISSVVSIAFTLIDITLLVRDWQTEHPTVEIVLETVKKIGEEKQILQDLLEVIESSRDQVENVLNKVLKEIKSIEENEDNIESDFVFVPKDIETC